MTAIKSKLSDKCLTLVCSQWSTCRANEMSARLFQITKMRILLLLAAFIPLVSTDGTTIEWAYNVHLDTNLELYCNDSRALVEANDTYMWKTPAGEMLSSTFNDSHYELKSDGQILYVKSLTEAQQGLYTCMVKTPTGGIILYVLRGINLSGRLYKNLNDKYEENVITAVVAALVFAVPMIGLCALQKFRYKSKNRKPKQDGLVYIPNYPEKTKPEVVVTAYDNSAAEFITQL